jgi:hypothetical protein
MSEQRLDPISAETPSIYGVGSPELGASLYGGSTENGVRSAIIEQHFPDDYSLESSHNRLLAQHSEGSAEHLFAAFAGPNGYIGFFRHAKRHLPLLNQLGYGFEEQEQIVDGAIINTIGFSHPTIERLNAFMDHADPDRKGIRYAQHDGWYTSEQFLDALAERGEILVPTQAPYEQHDHVVMHVLGWMGVSGQSLDRLRAGLDNYRPSKGAGPRAANLRMGKLDIFSSTAAQAIFGVHLRPNGFRPNKKAADQLKTQINHYVVAYIPSLDLAKPYLVKEMAKDMQQFLDAAEAATADFEFAEAA